MLMPSHAMRCKVRLMPHGFVTSFWSHCDARCDSICYKPDVCHSSQVDKPAFSRIPWNCEPQIMVVMFEEFVKRQVCQNWGGVAHVWFVTDRIGHVELADDWSRLKCLAKCSKLRLSKKRGLVADGSSKIFVWEAWLSDDCFDGVRPRLESATFYSPQWHCICSFERTHGQTFINWMGTTRTVRWNDTGHCTCLLLSGCHGKFDGSIHVDDACGWFWTGCKCDTLHRGWS